MIPGRLKSQKFAATRMPAGTDVDFGSLTHQLMDYLVEHGATVHLEHRVDNLTKRKDGLWELTHAPRHRPHPREGDGPVRVRRRGRRRAPPAAEVGHQGDPRLRRLPGQRRVPAHRQPGARRQAPREGLRQGSGRLPADVGAAPRPPGRGWRRQPDVRTVRGLQPQVPQARVAARPVRVGALAQRHPDGRGGARQPLARDVPDRAAAGIQVEEVRGPRGVRARRQPRRTGTASPPASACR